MSESLTLIKYNAFQACSSLESITIPDKVTAIEKQVFSQCTSLKTIVLGASVASIEFHAFNDCEAIESITCKNPTPAELGTEVFPKGNGWDSYTYIIYVPKGTKSEYDSEWTWIKNTGWEKDKITIVEQE